MTDYDGLSLSEGEVRRRLWATILELNVQAALDAGVPPALSLDDFETEAPSNVNDKDIDEQTETAQEHPTTTTTDASLQRFLLESLRPRLEIARRMNDITSDLSAASYNDFIALTNSITNSCRSCSANILRTNSTYLVSFHSNLADLLLRRFVLQLHRPLVSRARANAHYYFSRKISLDAAMTILSPARENAAFAQLVLRGGGMFKNRIIHASLAVASELLIEVEEQGLAEYPSPSKGPSIYVKMLMEALKEALRQSAERIRLGQGSVKLQMKLSMVMRQTELAGENASSMQQLAQCAKESLETSYAILQEWAAPEVVDNEPRANNGGTEDFDSCDFDPTNLALGSNFSLDDLFFLPAEFEMDGVRVG